MDPNKYYCNTAVLTSSSSLTTPTISTPVVYNNCGTITPITEYVICDLEQTEESLGNSSSSNSSKTPSHHHHHHHNHAGLNCAIESTTAGVNSNTSGYSSSSTNSSISGNYINVMPIPHTGAIPRRKLIQHEQQSSRLNYNSMVYKSPEDVNNSGQFSGISPSSSQTWQFQNHHFNHHNHTSQNRQQQENYLQQQTPYHQQQYNYHHHQQQQQQQQQQHQHQHQQQQSLYGSSSYHHYGQHPQNAVAASSGFYQQQAQQQQQQQLTQQQPTIHLHGNHNHHNHYHHHHHHHQQQQQQHHHHQLQQAKSSPQSIFDPIEEVMNCNLPSNMASATQTLTTADGCDQILSPKPTSTYSLPQHSLTALHPITYTTHHAATVLQMSTSIENTCTPSSSASSMAGSLRKDVTGNLDNITTPLSVISDTTDYNMKNTSGCIGSFTTDTCDNSTNVANLTSLCTSPDSNTNINCLANEGQTDNVPLADSSGLANEQFNGTASNSTQSEDPNNASLPTAPRSLQDVIPTCVYLMSRIAVHMEIEGTAQCPAQVMLAAALGCEELGIANKLLAQSIFGLWMTSALLDVQLKSHHRPFLVRLAWPNLLEKYAHASTIQKKFDEPMIMLKRNIFFSKRDEEKIKDHRILELLYEEAKYNVLSARYLMEPVHALMLGGIQARIELGPFNTHTHTVSYFRENQMRFLPHYVARNTSWSWLPISGKNSAEVRLLDQFKRVPQAATTRKLMRRYLEFCWTLPYYGAAFFHGQVEQPTRSLLNITGHKDIQVLIAVNERGVYIKDPYECTLLLGLRYEELSWDYAKPSSTEDPNCLSCIFIQFDSTDNGMKVSKLMQIFSRQAAMIDALISHFVEQMNLRQKESTTNEQETDDTITIQSTDDDGVLTNKLARLTLATFDEEGRCIGQMGTLSINY